MSQITTKTVVKIVVVSLGVGLLLAALGATPQDVYATGARLAKDMIALAVSLFGWAGPYLLLGGLVVVPLWLITYFWKRLRS